MAAHPLLHRLLIKACAGALLCVPASALADEFFQTNLVSDISGLAANTDANLKNPWGVSFGPTTPFWVSDQGTGKATLYDGAGNILSLVVAIPTGPPPPGPTGQVFNATSGFPIAGAPARFIFDTLNGTIAGWASGTTAVVEVTTPGANYTGLAIANVGSSTFLYAADATGHINVFDSTWTQVSTVGKFVDPAAIAGYVPFNIQTIGSNLYVTYAQLTTMGTGLPGGYIDEFDTSGIFIKRIATGGALYAPWGLTLAPSSFGSFANDLLVGNFGNGEILVYNPTTDAFLGTINGTNGLPLVDPFLWALETHTGGANDDPNAVYFTAGINNQADGLLGKIDPIPEPATIFATATALIGILFLCVRRGNKVLRS